MIAIPGSRCDVRFLLSDKDAVHPARAVKVYNPKAHDRGPGASSNECFVI